VLQVASIDIDCCLTEFEKEQLHGIPLQKPLTNILSSVEELNIASVKINESQDLINKEKPKRFDHFKILSTTWGSVLLTIVFLL
jgi:hypothetical protein